MHWLTEKTNFVSAARRLSLRIRAALTLLIAITLASSLQLNAVTPPGRVVDWGYSAFGSPTNSIAGLPDVIEVGAGSVNGLALRRDGSVVPSAVMTQPFVMPPGLTNILAIACGGIDGIDHNLALRSNGTVVAWGRNAYGQTNVPIWLTNVVAISAGGWHNLALRKDGTVVAWGYNQYGQTNVPAGLSNVVAIDAGDYHSLALRSNGTVVAWGRNAYGETTVPPGLAGIAMIVGGGAHTLALRTNGTVMAWGAGTNHFAFYPEYGQSIIPTGLTNVIAIRAGSAHSLALRADGTVVGWGYNQFGQTNTPIGLTNVVAISAGWFTSLAITAERVPILLTLAGQHPAITFHTFLSQRYAVEYSPDLNSNTWTPLPGGDLQGDGHCLSVPDPDAPAAPSRFYRVIRTQ